LLTAVFSTDPLTKEAREILSDFDILEVNADDASLARCQALMCWPQKAQKDLLSKMRGLRMVQTISAGADGIDFGALPPDTQVFSNAGTFTENVAEHAWGLLLGAAKGLHVRKVRTTPRRLRGGTLLIIGGGSIGSEVARLSKSLGMTTIGVSRSFRDPAVFDVMRAVAELPDLIGGADAVVLAIPYTRKTVDLLGYELLKKAKESVIVVNVGRAETVSEEGVFKWLKERPESMYVTDVYWRRDGKEAYDIPEWDLSNFAGSLHVSGLPVGEDLSAAKVAASWNVKRFFETGQALNHVDISEYF
jgi:D-3-phosphoglycerate dehydrogenase